MLIATVTTTVRIASTATATSQRPIEPPVRSRPTKSAWRGWSVVSWRATGPAAIIDVRSASVSTLGASGRSPLCTRTRSARISAAVWYRLSGFFASALSTTASSSGEMPPCMRDGGTGSSRTCW